MGWVWIDPFPPPVMADLEFVSERRHRDQPLSFTLRAGYTTPYGVLVSERPLLVNTALGLEVESPLADGGRRRGDET